MNPIHKVDGIDHKHCNPCDLTKPITDFYDYRKFGGQVQSVCRECRKTGTPQERQEQAVRRATVIIEKLARKIDEPTFRKILRGVFENDDMNG